MAASAGAVRAGGAYVEIFAKDGAFQQAMTRIQNRLKAVGAAMRTAGAGLMGVGMGIVSPILASAQAFASVGSSLYDMSKRTGVATEALSVLQYAAEQTGTDMASVETAVKKMQKAIYAAGNGSKEAAEALAMVGLTAQDLEGLTADQQMALIADGLMAIEDPGTRAAVAMALFGRSGTAILPMLEGGSAGMAAFAEEAKRLGLVMDGDTAAKADALGDAIDALKVATKMAFIQIGSAVAPILTAVAKKLAEVSASVGSFIQRNQQLIVTALKVGAGIVAFGAAVYGIGAAIGFASRAISVMLTVLRVLPMLFTPVGLAATAAFAAVAGGIVIARQLSPAFRKETDAIWKAIMKLDFATAWEIMNLNFAIALTQMAAKASSVLGTIQGFFAATGSFIGDKLIEGLDRFMGLFGADIITLQNGFERLGIYLRAAFDWDFAINGMDAAIVEADRKAEEARSNTPTAGARAEQRAEQRQAEADQRQQDMNESAEGWANTVETVRDDLDRAHDRLNEDATQTENSTTPSASPRGPLDISEPGQTGSGIGQTLGTFSNSSAGIGIGPELNKLEQPAIQTAANTARAAVALEGMAAANGAAIAPAAGGDGGVAAMTAAPMTSGVASAARAGVAAADWSSLGQKIDGFGKAIVDAVNAHAKISESHTSILEKIAGNTAKAGAVFV